jgi:hypothetical protein
MNKFHLLCDDTVREQVHAWFEDQPSMYHISTSVQRDFFTEAFQHYILNIDIEDDSVAAIFRLTFDPKSGHGVVEKTAFDILNNLDPHKTVNDIQVSGGTMQPDGSITMQITYQPTMPVDYVNVDFKICSDAFDKD